jgi:hypothetical protein
MLLFNRGVLITTGLPPQKIADIAPKKPVKKLTPADFTRILNPSTGVTVLKGDRTIGTWRSPQARDYEEFTPINPVSITVMNTSQNRIEHVVGMSSYQLGTGGRGVQSELVNRLYSEITAEGAAGGFKNHGRTRTDALNAVAMSQAAVETWGRYAGANLYVSRNKFNRFGAVVNTNVYQDEVHVNFAGSKKGFGGEVARIALYDAVAANAKVATLTPLNQAASDFWMHGIGFEKQTGGYGDLRKILDDSWKEPKRWFDEETDEEFDDSEVLESSLPPQKVNRVLQKILGEPSKEQQIDDLIRRTAELKRSGTVDTAVVGGRGIHGETVLSFPRGFGYSVFQGKVSNLSPKLANRFTGSRQPTLDEVTRMVREGTMYDSSSGKTLKKIHDLDSGAFTWVPKNGRIEKPELPQAPKKNVSLTFHRYNVGEAPPSEITKFPSARTLSELEEKRGVGVSKLYNLQQHPSGIYDNSKITVALTPSGKLVGSMLTRYEPKGTVEFTPKFWLQDMETYLPGKGISRSMVKQAERDALQQSMGQPVEFVTRPPTHELTKAFTKNMPGHKSSGSSINIVFKELTQENAIQKPYKPEAPRMGMEGKTFEFLQRGTTGTTQMERWALLDSGKTVKFGFGNAGQIVLDDIKEIDQNKGLGYYKEFIHSHPYDPERPYESMFLSRYPSGADLSAYVSLGAPKYRIFSIGGVTTVTLPPQAVYQEDKGIEHVWHANNQGRNIGYNYNDVFYERLDEKGYAGLEPSPRAVIPALQHATMELQKNTGIGIEFTPYDQIRKPSTPSAPKKIAGIEKETFDFLKNGIYDPGYIERYAIIENGVGIHGGYGDKNRVDLNHIPDILQGLGKKELLHTHTAQKFKPDNAIARLPSPQDVGIFVALGAPKYRIFSPEGITQVNLPKKLQFPIGGGVTGEGRLIRARRLGAGIIHQMDVSFDMNMAMRVNGRVTNKHTDIVVEEKLKTFDTLERNLGITVAFTPYSQIRKPDQPLPPDYLNIKSFGKKKEPAKTTSGKMSIAEARAWVKEHYPKQMGEAAFTHGGVMKFEKTPEGNFRMMTGGKFIPAGTTLGDVGKPVRIGSLYYESVIRPQFVGTRERIYGIPLIEQPEYKAASLKEQRMMRESEREGMRQAEKAYRGKHGSGGGLTGSVLSPGGREKAGLGDRGFSVSSGINMGDQMQEVRHLMTNAHLSPQQKRRMALDEEEEYLRSPSSIHRATGLAIPMAFRQRDRTLVPFNWKDRRLSIEQRGRQIALIKAKQKPSVLTVPRSRTGVAVMPREALRNSYLQRQMPVSAVGFGVTRELQQRQSVLPVTSAAQELGVKQSFIQTPKTIQRSEIMTDVMPRMDVMQRNRPWVDQVPRQDIIPQMTVPGIPVIPPVGFPFSSGGSTGGSGGGRSGKIPFREVIPLNWQLW